MHREESKTGGRTTKWLRKPKALVNKTGKGISAAGASLGKGLCFGPVCCHA